MYKSIIAEGARKRGLPKAYIRTVIDRLPVGHGGGSPSYRNSAYEARQPKSLENEGLYRDELIAPWWDQLPEGQRRAVGSRW
jgi:hypothetical protein